MVGKLEANRKGSRVVLEDSVKGIGGVLGVGLRLGVVSIGSGISLKGVAP